MNRREPLRGTEASRSLPATPRGSTSARASWDGPRLSLQALKETVLDRAAQYMSMPSSPTSLSSSCKKKKDVACSRRHRDEKAAAKEHAREVLRQAKETVASRKSGKNNNASSSPATEKRQSSFNNKENVPAAPVSAMEDTTKQLRVVVHQVQQTAKPPTTVGAPKPCAAEHHSPRVALAPLAPRQKQQPSPPPPPHRAKPSRPPPPPPPLDPPRTRARKPDRCERFATRIKKPAACPASAPPSISSASMTMECCSSAAAARTTSGQVSSSSPPLEEDPEHSYLRTVLERIKAVEAGAVAALVELLLDVGGRRVTELAVVAIDHLCGCAEGRSELVANGWPRRQGAPPQAGCAPGHSSRPNDGHDAAGGEETGSAVAVMCHGKNE